MCLTDKGCMYSTEDRPLSGLLLVPRGKSTDNCKSVLNLEYMRQQWAKPKLQKTLRTLVEHYANENFETVHINAIRKFIQSEASQKQNQWVADRVALYLADPYYSNYLTSGKKGGYNKR